MLTFKNITVRDAAMLRRYYENCDYALCEYSAGVKLMWRSALRYAWAEAAGCLIIRCESEGRVSFDYPVAGPEGDEDAAPTAWKRVFSRRSPSCRRKKPLYCYPGILMCG